jgi:Holliday junction resolvase RusA-like endonuclease
MTGIKLIFEGDPIPWQRARRNRNIYYDPQYQVKQNLKWSATNQLQGSIADLPLKKILIVNYSFFFQMPKSWSKKKQLLKENTYHEGKKDLDNLLKTYNDALTNCIWYDDCFIAEITASKRWALEGKTIIEVLT